MPEYPDITIYIERLEALVGGQPLEQIRFASPFFLRTAQPSIKTIHGAMVRGFERMGKRIVFVFDSERLLTDPHNLSGIGNAYSDEILHRARLSPIMLTAKLSEDQIKRLFHAARDTLKEWTQRLREEVGNGFPEKVTAFRENMAMHGRYKKPCPECGTAVQRIRYAANETNYYPFCQTGGETSCR
jgi:formamidopyrimidine-DNA glycosylase